MNLNFNIKFKYFELRSAPKRLARFSEDDKNHTIELVKWSKGEYGEDFCFTLAYWVMDSEGYNLKFVGNRMFEYVSIEHLEVLWEFMEVAQEVLDDYFESLKESD
jgi:hypothetical protein